MNPGIIISYVIAGFIILMIVTVGHNLNFSGTELTYTQIQKERMQTITTVLTHDLPKIGYNRSLPPDTMLRAVGDNFIEFYTNIDNSTDRSLELIRWELTSDSVTTTQNPNDVVLRRTVTGSINETSEFRMGVIEFNIRYFTALGSTTPVATPLNARTNKAAIDNIIQIEIELITESDDELRYSTTTDGRYMRSMWTKRFSPVNLRDF